RGGDPLDARSKGRETRGVTPEQAIKEAKTGNLRPVYLITGEERLFVDQVVAALRDATMKGGIAGFNEDKFTAGEASADAVLNASRMLPMMAKRRFVMVRGLDRWEKKEGDGDDDAPSPKKAKELSPLDALAEYAKAPSDSTVLVLLATKLHGQRRLVTGAKKGGYIVTCEPLSRRALPGWIENAAREKGHAIDAEIADLLAEIAGPELGYLADAIERLSLFVGKGAPITEDAVAKVVIRVRQSTVWELIDALGKRKLDRALASLADVYDPRDGGLRLLGAVSWSVRQLVKFEAAIHSGASPGEAGQRSGVPPFRVSEVAEVVRSVPRGTLSVWMRLLAEADIALKSSRRPAQAVLETMLLEMCQG
ncbi:MAG TPA: DNA polymerase III subunit delta, partial [Polyangiaceae bacterium]|nr:DNA polymerase III subunit delta [Polyangiaceae bacterium]